MNNLMHEHVLQVSGVSDDSSAIVRLSALRHLMTASNAIKIDEVKLHSRHLLPQSSDLIFFQQHRIEDDSADIIFARVPESCSRFDNYSVLMSKFNISNDEIMSFTIDIK